MRHDKLQEWAADTTNPTDEVTPHQARPEFQTPSQQTKPEFFNQEEEVEEAFDPDAGLDDREPTPQYAPPQMDEFEVKARQMGWVPKEQWNGNPDEWTPAKRFVQTGEMIQANRSLHQKVQYMENDFNSRLSNMRTLHEAQLKSNIEQLKSDRDRAVENADTEKYNSLNRQIESLEETTRQVEQPQQFNAPPLPDPANQQPMQPMQPAAQPAQPSQQQMMSNLVEHPTVQQWRNNNPWVNEDSPKTAYAERQFLQWVNNNIANPNATIEQGLSFVEEALTREFPRVNPNAQRTPQMAVKKGGPARRNASITLTMNDLDREERIIWQTMGKGWKNQADFLRACQDNREAN